MTTAPAPTPTQPTAIHTIAPAVTHSHAPLPLASHFNPLRTIRMIIGSRELAFALARREVENRYKANVLGIVWALATPLALLAVYTFVFGVVFHARWGNDPEGGLGHFALNVFLGLIVFAVFREVVARSPGLIVNNRQYVKRIVFPLECLSIADLLVALFNFAVGCVVWLVGFVLITGSTPHWQALLLPVLMLPVILTALGVSWFLSALGVFLRDIQHAVELAITVLMFLTPVFYQLDRVPEKYRIYLEWNPVAQVMEAGRNAAVDGTQPDWSRFAIALVASLFIATIGFGVFSKAKRAFADVL